MSKTEGALALIIGCISWGGVALGGDSTPTEAITADALAPDTGPSLDPLTVKPLAFKPGKGLKFESNDEDFALNLNLRAQFRYRLDAAPGEPEGTTDLSQNFRIRRARVVFSGHMFGPHNTYKAELAFSPNDLGRSEDGTLYTPLLSWYGEFDYLRDLTLRIGQYKLPYSRQRVVSSGSLQMVDRAIANGEFNLDRDVGFDLRSEDLFGLGKLRYYAGIYRGEGRDPNASHDFSLLYIARVEVLPFGLFADYKEASLRRPGTFKASLGFGYAFMDDGAGSRGNRGSAFEDGGTVDYQNANIDISARLQGFSFEGALFWREGVREGGDAVDVEAPRDGVGYYIQGGYLFLHKELEVSARYGQVIAAEGETSLEGSSELGVGLSNYMGAGHAFKLQGDVFRLWDDDFGGGSSRLRVQLQMMY